MMWPLNIAISTNPAPIPHEMLVNLSKVQELHTEELDWAHVTFSICLSGLSDVGLSTLREVINIVLQDRTSVVESADELNISLVIYDRKLIGSKVRALVEDLSGTFQLQIAYIDSALDPSHIVARQSRLHTAQTSSSVDSPDLNLRCSSVSSLALMPSPRVSLLGRADEVMSPLMWSSAPPSGRESPFISSNSNSVVASRAVSPRVDTQRTSETSMGEGALSPGLPQFTARKQPRMVL